MSRWELLFNRFNIKKFPPTQYSYLFIRGKLVVNLLLRFENIKEDIHKLEKEIDLPVILEKRMVSHHREYAYYYGKQERKIVNTYYRKDFQNFGYDMK